MMVQERIQGELADAMRRKDELRLSVLRMMKTAIRNREVEKRTTLDEAECQQVFSTLIKQGHDSIEQYSKGHREDLAEKEEAEIRVLEQYLPAPASESELEAAIEAAIAEAGATSAKQLGAVMKATLSRLGGRRVDGRQVNEKVRARLSSQ